MAVFVFGMVIGNKGALGFEMGEEEHKKLEEFVATTALIIGLAAVLHLGLAAVVAMIAVRETAVCLADLLALERAGFRKPTVRTVLSPAWTTDWMSDDGRRKLKEYGIAPPQAGGGRRALFGVEQVACPQCGSTDTETLSEFGSTSCKALWRCKSCREPFDYFKCH